MNLPHKYNHGLIGKSAEKAHCGSTAEDPMDALSQALNDSLAADFPNANLRLRPQGVPLTPRTPPLGHAGSVLRQAEDLLAAVKQLSLALTGTLPPEPGHTPLARGNGLLSQLAALDDEISRNLQAIRANVDHIRGQL